LEAEEEAIYSSSASQVSSLSVEAELLQSFKTFSTIPPFCFDILRGA